MKIGLIAMSGVRAMDKELMALGMTLPGFIERSKTIASLPSLGLLTLAGLTPEHHEVHYLEVDDINDLAELPGPFDLVAISSFTAQINEGYELARRYARCHTPVVIGGLHVTAVPDEAAHYGASAVAGEGELAWPAILEDAQRGQIRPMYDVRDQQFDLADAPMPRFELLKIKNYNRLTVQTSRGCPWRCAFCASSVLLTSRYKQKPIAKVLAEIDRIGQLWRRPFIEFADDNSFVNRAYWHELLPQLSRRRIKWFTETDLSVSEDEELLALAREAGCAELLIGFESPTALGLDGLELQHNWKARQYENYVDAIERIQAAGIRVNACFVVGLDGHGPEIFGQVLDFVETAKPFDVQITLPTPFPGTALYQTLKQSDRLLESEAWQRCTLFDNNLVPANMSPEQLVQGFRRLASDLYSEQATGQRREHFRKHCLGKRCLGKTVALN